MEDIETGNVRIHIVIFLTMMLMWGLNFIPTDKYEAGMLTYIAIMTGAIYFKINRHGKKNDAGQADSDATAGH